MSAPQLGKTLAGALWLLTAAFYGGASPRPWWWTAPTYDQAKHGFVRTFCELARSAGILEGATTTPPLHAVLTNGARIEARSWDDPQNLYGPTIRGAVLDEFGQLTPEAYGAISSRRAETVAIGEGFFRYLGNVGDIGGVAEDLWLRAERGESGFACRRWTWRDRAAAHACLCASNGNQADISPALETADTHRTLCARGEYLRFIVREKSRMSGPQFRQLYEAEWIDWNTLPVYSFDRAVHVTTAVRLDDHLPLDLTCDFNVDPMCWVIGQHLGDEAWAWDEIVIPGGTTTIAACQEFLRRHPGHKARELILYGDASGKARKTSAVKTDYTTIREIIGAAWPRLRMCVPEGNPAVADRINAVNAKLRAADGSITYRIHPRCERLANDYARVSWRQGTREIDKTRDRSLTHLSDAEGYRLVSLYPVNATLFPALVSTVMHPIARRNVQDPAMERW